MGHSEKIEPSRPTRSPEFEGEITAIAGLNCKKVRSENTRFGQAGGAKRIRTAGTNYLCQTNHLGDFLWGTDPWI
jgi:hypothetical protein